MSWALIGSRIFSSRSSHPGATLRFSASSRAAIPSSQSLIKRAASSPSLRRCSSSALQDAPMSSGCATWPLAETTYAAFSVSGDGWITEGGSEVGTLLYVYGSVTAVGNEMNGETVRGTCVRKGCVSTDCRQPPTKLTLRVVSYSDCRTCPQLGGGNS